MIWDSMGLWFTNEDRRVGCRGRGESVDAEKLQIIVSVMTTAIAIKGFSYLALPLYEGQTQGA